MSVIVKSMEMPIGCASCFVDRAYCRLWKKVPCGKWRDERHPSCPLIELPPHGRLIDADKLNIHDVSPAYGFCVMGVTEEDIELADTVIEGSET